MNKPHIVLLFVLSLCACTTSPITDPRTLAAAQAAEPGCSSPVLVSTGGPFPRNASTLAIRWTGFTNYELAYDGQVILLDAYFDLGSTFAPLGFRAVAVAKRAKIRKLSPTHGKTHRRLSPG